LVRSGRRSLSGPPVSEALAIDREALVDLSASIATRRDSALDRALHLARRYCHPAAVDEVLLQSHLFVGFPVALEAFFRWREISPPGELESETESQRLWATRGESICRTVYGRNYEKLRANVTALHPDLDGWMLHGGYGRVLGRPGLDLATRELCVVGLLVVWDSPRQLFSHLRGARNAGAPESDVLAALEIACRHLDPVRAREIRRLGAQALGGGRAAGVSPEATES
jgi:4-carboxymuconolactone decarboxylase